MGVDAKASGSFFPVAALFRLMNQGRMITTGKQIAASMYRSSIVESEIKKVSDAPRKNSKMAKQAAIYPITKGSTFLRLSSCQNRDSLLGMAMRLLTAIYGDRGYKSNWRKNYDS